MYNFSFKTFYNALRKPLPFEPGEAKFWDDEHISKGMLEAHLDQNHDAASRKEAFIDKSIQIMFDLDIIHEKEFVLDLGCGPGLYASKLARKGTFVTGLDFSKRSIEYAKQYALTNHLDIDYQYMNFFDITYQNQYHCVMQLYGELNTLNNHNRDLLLKKIYDALKPDGYFIFDITTRNIRKKEHLKSNYYTSINGFWKPNQSIVFEQSFDYEELDLWLDQYVVMDEQEHLSIYRNWFHDYNLDQITHILETFGFKIKHVFSDLTGLAYSEQSDWIALIVQK